MQQLRLNQGWANNLVWGQFEKVAISGGP